MLTEDSVLLKPSSNELPGTALLTDLMPFDKLIMTAHLIAV